jgi:large subunit ribosomal protein L34e
MPRGMHKSRTFRKVFVKTPSGKNTIQYKRRKPSKAICGSCKLQLAGVPRELPRKMHNLPKTAKRPERPYGGVLCSACTRKLLQQKARGEEQ